MKKYIKFKKWMLLILVLIIGVGAWFSYIEINKHNAYPYPAVYSKLLEESCTALIKNEDGTLAEKYSKKEFNWNGSAIMMLHYSVIRNYSSQKYIVDYSETTDRDFKTDMGERVIQKADTLEINLIVFDGTNKTKSDANRRVKITYSDKSGKMDVEYFNGATKELYESYHQDVIANLKSCG